MIPKVRKAVFPAAGLGTRFLPATKAQPKEMLPLVDKPLIQYGVEEAIHSGVQNIVIVTGRGKVAIEDHFDVSFELEHLLETRGKKDLLAAVRGVSDMIDIAYVRQREALGLGHAVLRAKELVGHEPFSVILSDDVIDAEVPCLRQLLDVYEFYGASVVALMEVPKEAISAYGVVDAEPVSHNGGKDRLYCTGRVLALAPGSAIMNCSAWRNPIRVVDLSKGRLARHEPNRHEIGLGGGEGA